MDEFDQAFYTQLTGGASLTALLAGTTSVYAQSAPREAALPYVIFSFQGGGDEKINPQRFVNIVYAVKGVSATSQKSAELIAAQIDALLHLATLAVSGWSVWWCMRESHMRYVETTPEGRNFWHAGGEYRIRASKN